MATERVEELGKTRGIKHFRGKLIYKNKSYFDHKLKIIRKIHNIYYLGILKSIGDHEKGKHEESGQQEEMRRRRLHYLHLNK